MSSLLGKPSVARWFSMPALSGIEGCHGPRHLVPVLRLSASDLSHGRHCFPGHPEAAGDVVSGDVVRDESEERCQRAGTAASVGAGQLRDSLDVAAQVETGDGPAESGSTGRVD